MAARPTHDSNGALLPAILCLHGGGSNATVFKIQTRRLIWQLEKQFRFVFAQAPIEGTPGFGMLPVFASCAPFYRWVNRRFKIGESDVETTPAAEVDTIDSIIYDVMQANGGVESFKGVMGFSQGARLTAGLLLRQKIQERDDLAASSSSFSESSGTGAGTGTATTTTTTTPTTTHSSGSNGLGLKTKFAFGIMIGGPYPPIGLSPSPSPNPSGPDDNDNDIETSMMADYKLLKDIPTVHAWGRDDHIRPGCEALARLCESDHSFQMDFEGGHHLPLKDVEAKDLCDLIMAAWYAGGGKYAVGADESY
jgi:predicted esterase